MGGGIWLQFFQQNLHFAVFTFTALVFFAVAWLYFDAWLNGKAKKEFLKWLGFGIAGTSFLVQALIIEQSTLENVLLGDGASTTVHVMRLIGFGMILAAQVIDPLQPVPKLRGLQQDEPAPISNSGDQTYPSNESKDNETKNASAWYAPVGIGAQALLPIAAFAIAVLYFRRATTGLERHLKKVAYAFAAYTLAEMLQLVSFLRDTDNPLLYDVVRLYGPLWSLQHLVLLIGSLYLGHWVWSYLTKRFFSQLLMIFVLTIGAVFLIISIGFTALLVKDIRGNAIKNLEVSTQVLNYAFNAKQSEASAAAEQVATSQAISEAVIAKDHQKLVELTKNYLTDKKQSELIITDQAGQVLLRASDTERWGDSISSDPLIKRALLGQGKSGVVVDEGVNVPSLQVRSAAIVKSANGVTIGTVVTGLNLDSAFISGIKQSTGLDSALYAGTTLAATTRVDKDGKARSVGTKLSNDAISEQVLKNGKTYSGSVSVANQEFIASFVPVKDPDNVPVAILSVDRSESSVLETAGKSIELTFILTSVLLVLSVVPVYMITRNLVKQIR